MQHVHNLKHVRDARKELRNALTPEEAVLWNILKDNGLGFKFRRQHSVGNFIADFYCPSKKLVIELDGSHHLEAKERDQERTDYLNNLNIKVLRFWNNDIKKDLGGVILQIKKHIEQ